MNNTTIENVHQRLKKLPFYHQLAFVYLLSKRLFPNYLIFNKKENWGDPDLLREANNLLKKIIISQTDVEVDIKKIIGQLEKVTPDTDDFAGFLTSLALDACASLLECLAFIIDRDNQRIQDISNSALDLAQMYIEFKNNTDFDDYCFDNQLFIEELNFQLNAIELLEKQQVIDEQFLTESKITKSRLGELITGITLDKLEIETITSVNQIIDRPVQFDKEIQEWIKKDNINLNELIPELVRNFYQAMKKIQNKAAF